MKFMENLRNISVKKRMTISFGIVTGLSSIAAIVAVIMLFVVNIRYSNALELNGFIQGDIGHYTTYLNEERVLVRDIVTATNKADVEEYKVELAEADEKIAYYFQEMYDKLENEEEMALTQSMISNLDNYHVVRKEVIALADAGKSAQALELLHAEAAPIAHKVVSEAEQLLAMNIEMGDHVSKNLSSFSIITIIVIIVLIVVAAAIGMIFARYTALDIAKPLEKVQKAAKKLAKGELDIEVQLLDKNEFGEMADDFNVAVAKMKEYIECIDWGLTEIGGGDFTVQPTVEFLGDFVGIRDAVVNIEHGLSFTMHQIDDGAEQVAMGAQQLAESAQTLAEGATSQAGAVEELTATIENVADSAESSAKKADDAYKNAQKFANVAEQSNQEMQLLTEAMERITATSKEIESIIGEIEDIASQTNLLSLNASIEAARAGEAGRGFAVVADQIGKLAADSAQSAVNTKNLIIKSLQEINNGNEITARTTSALGEVIEGIKFLADASQETSELSREQAETMSQVRAGIEQIADVVQNNSAAAQETSATSEELLAQSENLKAMVEQFKLLDE
ncbi:MAG: MCP four helix bundle domain-containing protein [Lachnospiraceae bacterium]|nr:MCP four helix bundle domain-containing protein [Lachnospiraceae bacterium]